MMNSTTLSDVDDEEANRLPENTLQQERRRSDGIFKHDKSRLSVVSKLWDIEHKGYYLTRSQRRARAAADKGGNNKGYLLTAEEAQTLGSEIGHLQYQYQLVQKHLKCVVWLLVLLCGATIIAAMYFIAVSGNIRQTITVHGKNGALMAGSQPVSVKSHGLKIFTYIMPSIASDGNKVCVSVDDLALAWVENENGGVATFIIPSMDGKEQVLRLGAYSNALMTKDKVSFGDLELVPDPECTVMDGENNSSAIGRSTITDDANRRLRENVQALREGRDIHGQLYMVAFSFSDGDL